ncbi:unnamed protein product, partial [Pleuronectes platessa]
ASFQSHTPQGHEQIKVPPVRCSGRTLMSLRLVSPGGHSTVTRWTGSDTLSPICHWEPLWVSSVSLQQLGFSTLVCCVVTWEHHSSDGGVLSPQVGVALCFAPVHCGKVPIKHMRSQKLTPRFN